MIKGRVVVWSGPIDQRLSTIEDTQVDVAASRRAGVWLVNGDYHDDSLFCMMVGVATEEDAARAYAASSKIRGHAVPKTFRVFPLVSLEPIELRGVIDDDGDEEWSAFSNAWVEVRL